MRALLARSTFALILVGISPFPVRAITLDFIESSSSETTPISVQVDGAPYQSLPMCGTPPCRSLTGNPTSEMARTNIRLPNNSFPDLPTGGITNARAVLIEPGGAISDIVNVASIRSVGGSFIQLTVEFVSDTGGVLRFPPGSTTGPTTPPVTFQLAVVEQGGLQTIPAHTTDTGGTRFFTGQINSPSGINLPANLTIRVQSDLTEVPEASTIVFTGTALLLLGYWGRKRLFRGRQHATGI